MIFVRHAMPVLDPAVPPTAWHLGDEGRTAARLLRLPAGAHLVASNEPKAVETLQYAAPGTPVHQDPGFAEVHRPAAWQPNHRTLARAYVASTPTPDRSSPPLDRRGTPAPGGSNPSFGRPSTQAHSDSKPSLDQRGPQAPSGSSPPLDRPGPQSPNGASPSLDRPGGRTPGGRTPDGRTPDGWESPAEVVARFGAAVERHLARAAGRTLVVATHGMALTCWLAACGLIAVEPARFWEGLRFPDLIEIDLTRG
ncbi:histidine phosphatase family protein [Actinoplanes sp. CA-054009]